MEMERAIAIPTITIADKCPYHIAYCMPVLRPPGTEDSSFLQQMLIMNGLRARGHALTFFAPYDLCEVVGATDISKPEFVDRTWTKKNWFTILSKLCWRMQRWIGIPYLNVFSNLRWFDAYLKCLPGHDIVQERNGIYKMGAARACRHLRLPYVYFFDADDILEHDLFGRALSGILRWRAKQVLRYNLKTAVRIICLSTFAKAHLKAIWKVPEEKIVIIPNAVDIDHFRPLPEARAEVRRKLGLDDCPLIVFVGGFVPYQDIIVLLEAFASVQKEWRDAHLLLVGEGEQYRKMVQHATDLGIADSTKFVGFQPHAEIPRLLSAADIAVAPYHKIDDERFLGSSMKIFEYMAVGLPIVASDVGQISEVIQNGVNGLLCPVEDAQALAAALKRLLADSQLRSRLGQQARKDSADKYSWEQYIPRFEKLYESILS
jgi:glycosyltransferase involved in cell wall biosynthesis